MDATADPVSPVDVVDPAPLPWDAVWGQPDAVEILRAAAADPTAMTHAWLITGPPGSGRSTLAYAFAAALIAEPGDETVMRQVLARTHPDLTALRTEQVIIRIDEARKLVERAFYAPSLGRHRVIVVEDADRMAERTSNVLLKALEEPPDHTVWVLCAPSDADLLPTIRSRVRTLRLRDPEAAAANLKCPLAFIRGEHSVLMKAETWDYMKSVFTRSPFVSIPNTQHHLILDDPIAVTAALDALIEGWARRPV